MTYAPIATNRLGRLASSSELLLPLRQLVEYAGRLIDARRGRRAIARLAGSEDTVFRDIGIVRADLEWALGQPWNADPSRALALRVKYRKEAARRGRKI